VADRLGAATPLGFAQEDLAALAPVGDGRVYFQRRANNPNHQVEWLDANNAAHVLLGLDLYLQAGFADPDALKGASLSNGLRVQAV